MLELAQLNLNAPTEVKLGYGGDTLNTAIYLAKFGIDVEYVTALGDDPYSDWMISQWQQRNVSTTRVRRFSQQLPGLYAIDVDNSGERNFFYWRQQSAAKLLFDKIDVNKIIDWFDSADLIYFSGITLSIYDNSSRVKLLKAIHSLRKKGKIIAFDPNFRPALWNSDDEAKDVFSLFLKEVDIALPTFDDEQALYKDNSVLDTINRFKRSGVAEIVVKDGVKGCTIHFKNKEQSVSVPDSVDPVDTTAAGDSFNAAYIAARIHKSSCRQAALEGHRLAGKVIQHRGAIVDL